MSVVNQMRLKQKINRVPLLFTVQIIIHRKNMLDSSDDIIVSR